MLFSCVPACFWGPDGEVGRRGKWSLTLCNVSREMNFFRFKPLTQPATTSSITGDDRDIVVGVRKRQVIDLGNGSELIYIPRFLSYQESWDYFHYINKHIPWTRPTIRVFGRSSVQPRDTCYIADKELPDMSYSGYQPHAYSWDDYPPLKELLELVRKELPGSIFNCVVLNRYKGGNDYVSWHSDDNEHYGPTPEIASITFGCEREFMLKEKPNRSFRGKRSDDEPPCKRMKKSGGSHVSQHTFALKHGSLLVMRGYTQRDWLHSVPKRAKLETTRINLTFRRVLC